MIAIHKDRTIRFIEYDEGYPSWISSLALSFLAYRLKNKARDFCLGSKCTNLLSYGYRIVNLYIPKF